MLDRLSDSPLEKTRIPVPPVLMWDRTIMAVAARAVSRLPLLCKAYIGDSVLPLEYACYRFVIEPIVTSWVSSFT